MEKLKNLTWQGVVVLVVIVGAAVAVAKMGMTDVSKGLVAAVVGLLALHAKAYKDEGDA